MIAHCDKHSYASASQVTCVMFVACVSDSGIILHAICIVFIAVKFASEISMFDVLYSVIAYTLIGHIFLVTLILCLVAEWSNAIYHLLLISK